MCIRDRPSAWVSRENVRWHYDGRYFEREMCVDGEIFEISINYKELRGRVKRERDDYIEFLPHDVIGAAVDDDNVVNDEVIT